MSFAELARARLHSRVPALGDRLLSHAQDPVRPRAARGRPFFYFAYGAAVSEVVVDTLTGEYRLLRADLLHDVGRSINPAIDLGQIEGGFIQGIGWLTTEELCWDEAAGSLTHAPSTYKIPTARDVPADFRVRIFERGANRELAVVSLEGGRRAAADARDLGVPCDQRRDRELAGGRESPALDAPATPERVLMAIEDLKRRATVAQPAASQAAE